MSFTTRTRIHSIGLQLKTLTLAVASALLAFNAGAAGLGDLKVQSHLGQPLRAEVELISMPGDSDAPLIKLASQDVYQKANVEFSPLLLSLRFATEQRGDRKIVRITSTQPINEPFVDMLLELKSNTNSVVREYVFLLDPASLISAPVLALEDETATRAAAQSASASRTSPVAQAEKTPARRSPPKKLEKSETAPAAADKATAPAAAAPGKPRLSLTSPRLAGVANDDAGRAAGKEFAAMEQAVAEANARVIALEQKVTDLQNLLQATNSLLAEMQRQKSLQQANAAATAATPATATPAVATPAATPAATPPVAIATAASAASTPSPAESKPAATVATPASASTPKPAVAAPVSAPPEEDWSSNLLLLPGVALLLAGLGAVGLRVARRRKQVKPFEDSLFAASTHGPQSERQPGNTFTANLTNLFPSTHSEDIDTVAEADVYIAYGRDGQAEDLLKEALRKKPGNRAVSMKLLSIYATRKDGHSFEPLARELRRATNGEGEDWTEVADMGRGIDPENPLYAASQADSAKAPVANAARKAIVLETPDSDAPVLDQLLDLGLDAQDRDAAPAAAANTTLTDEEEQLAELLSHPLAELEAKTQSVDAEPADDVQPASMDVDLAMKQLDEPVFHTISPQAEATLEAGIGPIDFEAIIPEIRIEQKDEALPEIPSAALETPKASANLIEFDFLQPAKSDAADDLPEIPLALPVENPGTDEEAKLFELKFVDEKIAAITKR